MRISPPQIFASANSTLLSELLETYWAQEVLLDFYLMKRIVDVTAVTIEKNSCSHQKGRDEPAAESDPSLYSALGLSAGLTSEV